MQGEAFAFAFARHRGAHPSPRLLPPELLLLSGRRGQEAWSLLAVPVLPALDHGLPATQALPVQTVCSKRN